MVHLPRESISIRRAKDSNAFAQPYFDWALNESCFNFQECGQLQPFIDAGKAVFQTEYDTGQYCRQANGMNFKSIVKPQSLDA